MRWKEGTRDAALLISFYIVYLATVRYMAWLFVVLPDWVPTMDRSTADALGWSSEAVMAAHIAFTGVGEELVIVGAVMCLGTAARMSTATVCCLSIGLRIIVHLYLGGPALSVILLGAVGLYLYAAYRRLTPLVIGHILYDLFPITI